MSFAPQGSVIRSCNGMFMAMPMNPIKNNVGSLSMPSAMLATSSLKVIKNDEKNDQPKNVQQKSSFERRNELREISISYP